MTDEVLRLDNMFGAGGLLDTRLPDFEERPQQVELAQAIEAALRDGEHICAEAGTGVGKSFAYLMPAVLYACTHPGKGPVVVSTRTIALQEQLERKDLPFLQSVLPLEWSVVSAVGRNHYVCLRRMQLAHKERGSLFPDRAREAQLDRILDWSRTTHDGLRMELEEPVDDTVWDEVKAEHGNCLYKACPHYEGCPFQRSRRRMETAQILIVNHALYMADVALRMVGVNYLPDHRVVVFDEAHHLERVATESLGLRLSLGTVEWFLRRLHPKRSERSLLARHGSARARILVEEVRLAAHAFFAELEARLAHAGGHVLDLGSDELDDPLSTRLLDLAAEVMGSAVDVESLDVKMEMQARAKGLQGVCDVTRALARPGETATASVRWIEDSRRGPVVRSAPLAVADALREHVFGGARRCILVSATLGPADDHEFAWLRGQIGIDRAATLRLGSPFDFERQVEIVTPEGMPDPARDAQVYLRACRAEVRQRVVDNGGRALVLCTSWAFVRAMAEELRDPLADVGVELLVQGEAPLRDLLRRKRNEPTSVLVGTETFWEGIDVPGDALTLVVITRLPFAQPDHPLTRARVRAIEARGGDAFVDLSLPTAILKFRQGFGRLVRSSSDRGQVVILDPRLRTKGYGRRFRAALPSADGA